MKKISNEYRQWLKRPISKLRLSTDFLQAADLHGFTTLEEMICYPLQDLVKKEWFTGSLLCELSELVERAHIKMEKLRPAATSKKRNGE